MRAAGLSDIGLVRTRNEDAFWYDELRGLFVIADGLGAAQAGEVASALAVEIVSAYLFRVIDAQEEESEFVDNLFDSFQVASQEIYAKGQSDEKFFGMACSLLTAIVRDGCCYVGHAGDSRAYLLHEGILAQMTVDDTPVAAMVKRGYILPEKAQAHSLKNVLTKSVGSKPSVEANMTKFPIKTGERLMLCSDGLWSGVQPSVILEILLRVKEPAECCRLLIDESLKTGGKDNITVIVYDVDQTEPIESMSGDSTAQMPQTA